ncbi:MAG: NfeD family protein [Steroidobacterales bacterium]
MRAHALALLFVTTAVALAADSIPPAAPKAGVAMLLEINGPIGPATSDYVVRALKRAAESSAPLVIFEMDTPGGLDTSMREIIKAILASPVPVATYVSPSGARAASAGTYILYASHVAAMAPATNLGAATPVSIGGESPSKPPSEPTGKPTSGTPEKEGAEPATALERKIINDAVAYIRGLAELRGRNADWAEQAVRRGASLPAQAALKQHVIDLIARDLDDLLAQLDGRKVEVPGRTITLAVRGIAVERQSPDWRTQFLAVITHPTIAYGLLLIGIYGLLFEGYSPGAILPGVAGAICLLIGLYALQILSVNYAGLALLLLGIGMLVAEFFVASFGTLGIGGLIAFIFGSIILFEPGAPGYQLALPVIIGAAITLGAALFALIYLAARAHRRPLRFGVHSMIGRTVEVIDDFESEGRVRVGGEIWNARSGRPLRAGERVRILKVEGLTVWVDPLKETEK